MSQILRVLPRLKSSIEGAEAPLVADPHGTEMTPQRRRFIGRQHREVAPGQWGWVPISKPEELAYHHDIAKAIRDRDLWAADAATAKACGVKFDPTFGGEYAGDDSSNQPDDPGGKAEV